MTPRPALTVVVPAHQEEVAIGRCLAALRAQDLAEPFEVVVVANGCRDLTAVRAAAFGPHFAAGGRSLRVVELTVASKSAAMNAGDAVAGSALRAYLDADAVLSPTVLRRTVEELRRGALLCGAELRVAPCGNRLGDAYAAVWAALPDICDRVVGVGYYAVAAAGRARWGVFPDVLSDDKLTRARFAVTEQVVLTDAWATTYLPGSVGELVRVRARWCRGNRQLRREVLATPLPGERGRLRRAAVFVARTPRLWRSAPAAALVFLAGWLLSLRHPRSGTERWARADSASVRIPTGRSIGPAGGPRAEGGPR